MIKQLTRWVSGASTPTSAGSSPSCCLADYFASRAKKGNDKAQSDRWGIFIGHWAPTFFALGVALRLEEEDD